MTLGVLLSALLLQPVLAEPGDLRVVAVGADVEWRLDGEPVANTTDGAAATIQVPAGRHDLWAVSSHEGSWRALARLEPESPQGAAFVPAWTAEHAPSAPGRLPDWAAPLALAAAAAAFGAWPSRGRRRGRSPTQGSPEASENQTLREL